MKLIYCLFLLLVATVFSSNLMRKRKTNRLSKGAIQKVKCPKITNFQTTPETVIPEDDTAHYFPEDYYAGKATVLANALSQTEEARKLLVNPVGQVLTILKQCAASLNSLNKNKFAVYWTDVQDNTKNTLLINYNRQISSGGSMEEQTTEGKSIISLLGRVSNGNGKNMDNLGFMGLLGDIGAVLFDFADFDEDKKQAELNSVDPNDKGRLKKLKENIDNYKNYAKKILQDVASFKFIGKTSVVALNLLKTMILKNKGILAGSSIYPKKQSERGNCINIKNEKIFDKRAGLLSLAKDTALKAIKWPWQTLPVDVMNKCPDEPFMGHFSGSIIELLFMLDILTWDASKINDLAQPDIFIKNSNSKLSYASAERKAKAALASAFLLGTGMHSAVEVAPTVRHYLQILPLPTVPIADSTKIDSSYCNQTNFIVSLMKEANN